MAFFGKKKKEENTTAVKAEEQKEETRTLDLIKETMEEAKEERHNQASAPVEQPVSAEDDMPTEEEIRKAQEILARAAAKQANTIPAGTQVGVNAPVNTAELKKCIADFLEEKSEAHLKAVMECLQKGSTLVCVPAQIITSPENQEKMKQGGQVKLDGPVQINPIILTDNTGKKVFPIFSGEDTIPDDIKTKTPKVNMPLGHALNIMKGIADVDTFALDPFTANIRIGVNTQQNPPQENK